MVDWFSEYSETEENDDGTPKYSVILFLSTEKIIVEVPHIS